MSSVLPASQAHAGGRLSRNAPWFVVLAGFAAMYVPVWWTAATGIWQTDDNAHGALILAVLVWLFWGVHKSVADAAVKPAWTAGSILFAGGLFLFFVGRVAEVLMMQIASQAFVVAGLLLLLRGTPALRVAWFPVLYFVFMIPLPGTLVDAVTQPLKQSISVVVVEILYKLGYPISRSGVVLTIGQYQMLVADACSGLHSMFSLSALGTLFMYITRRTRKVHNALMLISILPIAYVANIVRVMALVLITYHLGDEAGQGFLHGFAGMVLMLVSLASFFALDRGLLRLLGENRHVSASPAAPPAGVSSR